MNIYLSSVIEERYIFFLKIIESREHKNCVYIIILPQFLNRLKVPKLNLKKRYVRGDYLLLYLFFWIKYYIYYDDHWIMQYIQYFTFRDDEQMLRLKDGAFKRKYLANHAS